MFDETGEKYLDCINNVAHGKQFILCFMSNRNPNALVSSDKMVTALSSVSF